MQILELNKLHDGDNIAVLRGLPSNSVDSIVTDSPYGLNKAPDILELLSVWGGSQKALAASRVRLCRLRDSAHATGHIKSLIDAEIMMLDSEIVEAASGILEVSGGGFMGKKWDAFVPQPPLWKECLRVLKPGGYLLSFFGTRTYDIGSLAIRIAGFEIRDCIMWVYGQGMPKSNFTLKPAIEPICMARKPGPMLDLNIDAARIPMAPGDQKGYSEQAAETIGARVQNTVLNPGNRAAADNTVGRWPANVILDPAMAAMMDFQSGVSGGDKRTKKIQKGSNGAFTTHKAGDTTPCYQDIGGASRYFFQADFSEAERRLSHFIYCSKPSGAEREGNDFVTIKPKALMRHLVKLVTPAGGVCLDVHSGSGTTPVVCIEDGINWIAIDNDRHAIDISSKRIARAYKQKIITDSYGVQGAFL